MPSMIILKIKSKNVNVYFRYMLNNIIIIPDVHGRTFWKEPVYNNINKDDTHIVFLGDYLDAYKNFEGISDEDAIANFEEIIEVTKSSNNITLLLGNHDLHYFPQLINNWGCRRYEKYKNDISNMFMSNLDLFKIAYDIDINSKKYIFTHAGVNEGWFKLLNGENRIRMYLKDLLWVDAMRFPEDVKEKFTSLTLNANSLNSLLSFDEGIKSLWMISKERGGCDNYASCVWCDIHEHFDAEFWNKTSNWYQQVYQIFSHTFTYPSVDEYYIGDNFAMLDARTAFVLNCENGKINVIK